MTPDEADPKGLIRESYRIEGISPGECRSVFLDWALSLPPTMAPDAALAALIAHHARAEPDHPMSRVLRDGTGAPSIPRRRGGRAGRFGDAP